jgi:hypothetical protein
MTLNALHRCNLSLNMGLLIMGWSGEIHLCVQPPPENIKAHSIRPAKDIKDMKNVVFWDIKP